MTGFSSEEYRIQLGVRKQVGGGWEEGIQESFQELACWGPAGNEADEICKDLMREDSR